MTLALATITSPGYWAQTRALAASLLHHAPELRLHVLVLADGQKCPAAGTANMVLHTLDQIGLADWKQLTIRFSLFELACALKPPLLLQLLKDQALDIAAYIDSDMMFFSSPTIIADRLQGSDILLTPHFAAPNEPCNLALEKHQFLFGTYNGGFLAVRNAENGRAFLRWWGERALRFSSEDPSADVYTDQQWLDLVPGLFPQVAIERHPGFNVAQWNLYGRKVEKHGNGYRVNGEPLVFFHFTQARPGMDWHQQYGAAVGTLFGEYYEALKAQGYTAPTNGSRLAAQDCLPNGERVPSLCRQVLRSFVNDSQPTASLESVSTPIEIMHKLVTDRGFYGAQFRTSALYQARLRRLGRPEEMAQRYASSRAYRWFVDAWFYLFGTIVLKLPEEWIEPSPGLRLLRRALLAPARLVSELLRRAL
jgi:hypothetical protein